MNGRRRRRHRVAAVVEDPGLDAGPLAGLLAGPLTRLGGIIAELRPDRIVVALADRRGRLPMSDLLRARVSGVVVEEGAECYERLTGDRDRGADARRVDRLAGLPQDPPRSGVGRAAACSPR
jgi:hypothetical protein